LLLSGTADRSREFAIRAALGAGRFRLARLVIVEASLLGLVAGVGSALLAQWAAGLIVPLLGAYGQPVWLDVSLDARTLGFAAATGFGAALLAGVLPALQVFRARAHGASLADGGRGASRGPAGARFRSGLLVAQFALSLALVAVAGLFIRTVANLLATPTGYDVGHVSLLAVDPTAVNPEPDAIRQYLDAAAARLGAVPGVRAVGFARVTPVGIGGSRMSIQVPGYDPQPDEDMELNYNAISEGYFSATGIPLRAGRELTRADSGGRPLVAVVNETMARRFWAGRPALGQSFMLGERPVEVVGIVPDVKYRTLREAPRPSFYMSIRQLVPRAGVFHVRTHDDAAALLPTLRRAVAEVDPRVPIADARTLRQQVRDNVSDDRLAMLIGAALAGTALLLAAAGLFASMWYAVGRRTREIGVRMALGADAGVVSRSVVRQSLRLVLIGSALGAGLAFWAGQVIESRLYQVSPADPVSFAAAGLVLGAAALLASWAPARRAARVDPVVALRLE
jgi:predicted permease